MTTQAVAQAPAGRGVLSIGNPLNSVRKGLVAGFGLLVLILVAVVAGSAWLVRDYQSNTALMEEKADTALLIQGAESHVGTAGSGAPAVCDRRRPGVASGILSSAEAASQNLDTVRAREVAANDTEDVARLQAIDTTWCQPTHQPRAGHRSAAAGDTPGA